MKKLVLGIVGALAALTTSAAMMATRQYVDDATNKVVTAYIPYDLKELVGSVVKLDDRTTSFVEVNTATVIQLPSALPADLDTTASRNFQVVVDCPHAVPEGTKFYAPGLSFVTASDAAGEQDLAIVSGKTLFSFTEIKRNTFMVLKVALVELPPAN